VQHLDGIRRAPPADGRHFRGLAKSCLRAHLKS
jgi:hypothetical protein